MKKYLLLIINVLFSFPLDTSTTDNIIDNQPLNQLIIASTVNCAVLGHGPTRRSLFESGKVITIIGTCLACSSELASNCVCNAMNVPLEDTATRNCAFALVDFTLLGAIKLLTKNKRD